MYSGPRHIKPPARELSMAHRRATNPSHAPWRRNLRLYPWFYFFHDLQVWLPIWILFSTDHIGLSFTELGVIGPFFYVILSFGQAPAGALADRYGRVNAIRAGVFIYIAFMFVFAFSTDIWSAAVAWALWGTALTLVVGADSAFLHDSLQAMRREREFERRAGLAFGARSLAMLTATLIGGEIAARVGLQNTVLLGVIVTTIALLIATRFREPPRGAHRSANGAADTGYLTLIRESLLLVWRRKTLRYGMIFFALTVAATVPAEYLFQPLIVSFGIDIGWQFSFLQAPSRLLAIVGAVTAFWWATHFGQLRSMLLMAALMVVAFLAVGLVDHVAALLPFALIGFTGAVTRPLIEGYVNRRVPSRLRATALSLNQMGWALILLFALPLLFGPAVDREPLRTVLLGLAAGLAICVTLPALLWMLAHRAEARRQRNEAPSRDAIAKPQHSAAPIEPVRPEQPSAFR